MNAERLGYDLKKRCRPTSSSFIYRFVCPGCRHGSGAEGDRGPIGKTCPRSWRRWTLGADCRVGRAVSAEKGWAFEKGISVKGNRRLRRRDVGIIPVSLLIYVVSAAIVPSACRRMESTPAAEHRSTNEGAGSSEGGRAGDKSGDPKRGVSPQTHGESQAMLHTNRLSREKSPYLLQHQHNPVDWYPWGEEAFKAAKEMDRPIFLSIGYATCHWCHVMEHESFEDETLAAFLNAHFIPIKVDREERPDVDEIYMNALHAMGHRGGWPLSMFLTPDLKPFYGGTYWPRPRFELLLKQIAKSWAEDREQILSVGSNVIEHLNALAGHVSSDSVPLDESLLKAAYAYDDAHFDSAYGGFGGAPKFPPSMQMRLLLRIHRRTGDAHALEMVTKTLDAMARGGIYDHIGGGFARYSTDARWLVPHFEKMLYTNALMTVVYLEAYQATGEKMFSSMAENILGYVLRDMTAPNGGFYTAEDADSDGEEGKFYVWTQDELRDVLLPGEFEAVRKTYGVTTHGNFDHGTNIFYLKPGVDWFVREQPPLSTAREKLFRIREKRVHPLKDDKQLTSWNGLMIDAFARAYQVLHKRAYLSAAREAARFIETHLMRDGRLLRRYRDGEARYDGLLEDYAYLIQGLITLYESDFDPHWIELAVQLQREQDRRFKDSERGGYYHTEADAEHLLVRQRDFTDGALPNANAVSALNLLRLHALTLEPRWRESAIAIMRAPGTMLSRHPSAFSQLLIALDFLTDRAWEIAIVGADDDSRGDEWVRLLQEKWVPNRVMALATSSSRDDAVPLLRNRPPVNGRTTVYLCEGFTCQRPTSDLDEVIRRLDDVKRWSLHERGP